MAGGFGKVGGPKVEIEGENRRGEGMPLCLVSLHSMDLNLKHILSHRSSTGLLLRTSSYGLIF
jgi:hypothetical protein